MIALAFGVLITCAIVSGDPGPYPMPQPGPYPGPMPGPYPMAQPLAMPYPGPMPLPNPTIGNRGSANQVFGFGAGYPTPGCPLGYNCDVGGCPPFFEPYPVIEGYPYPGLPY